MPSHPLPPTPDPCPARADWVVAAPFRAHLQGLHDTGLSPDELALLLEVPRSVVRRLLDPDPRRLSRPRIRTVDAQRLIAATPALLDDVCAEVITSRRAQHRAQLLANQHGRAGTELAVGMRAGEWQRLATTAQCRRIVAIRLALATPTLAPMDEGIRSAA